MHWWTVCKQCECCACILVMQRTRLCDGTCESGWRIANSTKCIYSRIPMRQQDQEHKNKQNAHAYIMRKICQKKNIDACTQHLADSQNLRIHRVPETHPINTTAARATPASQTSHLCRRPAWSASPISNMSRQRNTLEPRHPTVLSNSFSTILPPSMKR